jgi:para-aminobenzoate synthetase component 1
MTTAFANALMNQYGSEKTPFLFVIDFEMEKPFVVRLDDLAHENIRCAIHDGLIDFGLTTPPQHSGQSVIIEKEVIDFATYQKAFDLVKNNLLAGNSFLTNLTAETPVSLNTDLDLIFDQATAKYKLYFKDLFLCFSPETFVQIDQDGKISSFPMKGTIDAEIPGAKEIIMHDEKELFEHTTIVDLIRNDLSKVCSKVWVENFRYIENITKEDGGELLQVSSKVSGLLPSDWENNIGDIISSMLPAGSISGAPKPRTLEIIREAEKITYDKNHKRGYYTGIFGIFDGKQLSSGVMIRYLENTPSGLVYKSGGGITARSSAENEYQEMIQKIYVPIL